VTAAPLEPEAPEHGQPGGHLDDAVEAEAHEGGGAGQHPQRDGQNSFHAVPADGDGLEEDPPAKPAGAIGVPFSGEGKFHAAVYTSRRAQFDSPGGFR